jgi:hypothetical protein
MLGLLERRVRDVQSLIPRGTGEPQPRDVLMVAGASSQPLAYLDACRNSAAFGSASTPGTGAKELDTPPNQINIKKLVRGSRARHVTPTFHVHAHETNATGRASEAYRS